MSKIQNIPYLIIIVLVAVLFIQRCNTGSNVVSKPIHDTIIKTTILTVHDTIPSKPKLVSSTPTIHWDTVPFYVPDTNYNRLRLQYEALGDKYFTKNIYTQSYRLDTFGTATITDTILQNQVKGQLFKYFLNIPTKTITITNTIPYKPTNQLYVGGAIIGNKTDIVNGAELSLLFKNKKDQIYQLGVEQSFSGKLSYKVGTYFKIHL